MIDPALVASLLLLSFFASFVEPEELNDVFL